MKRYKIYNYGKGPEARKVKPTTTCKRPGCGKEVQRRRGQAAWYCDQCRKEYKVCPICRDLHKQQSYNCAQCERTIRQIAEAHKKAPGRRRPVIHKCHYKGEAIA